ncbi:bifunctional protein [Oceanospirillum sp. MED92]|uniref:mannose-1-phosphate guanylyltransferase n=2 Tax=Neptuniibacter caesariensis TaxID=207954 RepID=A0A7U8C437_NEPCE|nr:bifunctional protein [Oceanospirillum sp. MED92] [Neptuniibacter caesariensis]
MIRRDPNSGIDMIIPVIMAGGAGTRLWPLSRKQKPKQFLNLLSPDYSMLQTTYQRISGLKWNKSILVCNEEHRFLAAEQIRKLEMASGTDIILEPEGKNTAPTVALAAHHAQSNVGSADGEPILLVLSADHEINDICGFEKAVSKAITLAKKGKLVTFGTIPSRPETGYGYIKSGAAEDEGFEVVAFEEKPDLKRATEFLNTGGYLWNTGMFMFKASTYLSELQKYAGDIHKACEQAYQKKAHDLDFVRVGASEFINCPSNSIDYAIMEHTKLSSVIPIDVGWSDVGSWKTLWDSSDKDSDNNVILGDVLTTDTQNSYIRAENRLVTTIGVNDLIVIESQDSVLVAPKSASERIKDIVTQLQTNNRHEHISHPLVHRPWGHYYSIFKQDRYQVKHITVKPGAKLSTQMHHHRSEHWIIVSGAAQVTKGEQSFLLAENESTYIPIGTIHALENPGLIPLELIEVQAGPYLGEDDIIRFDDRYGRS